MSEITLGDLLSWHENHIGLLKPEKDSEVLNRPVSWAESIRVVSPVLPRLRGDEIIVVRSRTLEELEAAENISWSEISSLLQAQPIAAVLVDVEMSLEWPSQIPMLTTSSEFLANAETDINRNITERRAELYRVGSDLARAMSVLSLSGAGVTAVLNVAERISGVSQLLLDSRQQIISKSPGSLDGIPGSSISEPLIVAGRATGYTLVARIDSRASADIGRLVLTQTSQQLGMLLDRGTIELPVNDPPLDANLELRKLLTGTDSTSASRREIRQFQARLNDQNIRVALISSDNDQLGRRLSKHLPADLFQQGTALDSNEYAFLLTAGGSHQFDLLRKTFCRLLEEDKSARLTISETAADTNALPGLYQETKALSRLARSGILDGTIIDSEERIKNGVEGLFVGFWHQHDKVTLQHRQQLSSFRNKLLEKLIVRDRRQRSDLVHTLEAYLLCGGMAHTTAKTLGIHRNTLNYRLNLMQTITGHDFSDPETRVLYRIAFAVRNLDEVFCQPIPENRTESGSPKQEC